MSIGPASVAQANLPAPARPSTAEGSATSPSQVPGNIPGTIFDTWQGTVSGSSSFGRVVVRIAKNDDGSLGGTLTFIDRGPQGPSLQSLNYAAPELSFSIGNVSYRGKLSADASSIDGTWTEDNASRPLTLARATPATRWTYSGPAPLPAMAANADPAFEVATIKPSRGGAGWGMRGRELQGTNLSAKGLIELAYNLRDRQVIGGPGWTEDERFDVVGEPDAPGKPSTDQMRTMFRKLLEDRFGLKVHAEQRDFAVYALTVDKPPAKLTPSAPAPDSHMGIYPRQTPDGEWYVQYGWFTMADFADQLMNWIQSRQIVDETSLKGQFDFAMTIPASVMHPGPDDSPDADLARAIAPLGLKFVPKHELLEVFVVDAIDKPSAN